MTDLQKRILHVFDEYVFGFMRSDINAGIAGNANYLTALGLVSYTEVLGGLRTGKLGVRNQSSKNFNAFLAYMGPWYADLKAREVDLYDVVRCGLVHNYFIKGESTIWMYARADCGIVSSPGGPTFFNVQVYANDLFDGAKLFRDEILESDDPALAQNFEKGMKEIKVWS
jgi:hypothetical protein